MSARTAGQAEAGRFAMMATARAALSPSTLDPRLFYPSLGHQDALERLRYSAVPGSLAVVSGEEGIGKTLLLGVLLDTQSRSVASVVIEDPGGIRPDTRFLRSLIELAGGAPHGRTGLELTSEFIECVAVVHAQGRTVSILVDDSHRLSSSQLEILRALLSSASASHPVNVVLFGEPELLDKIGRKRHLAERVTMHHALNPLNPDDARAMLDHRMRVAEIDTSDPLFTSEALDELFARSRGNPGAMFALAERAIAAAIDARFDHVDAPLVRQIGERRTSAELQIRLPFGEEPAAGDMRLLAESRS